MSGWKIAALVGLALGVLYLVNKKRPLVATVRGAVDDSATYVQPGSGAVGADPEGGHQVLRFDDANGVPS